MEKQLDAFDRWMVKSNLKTIAAGEDAARLIALIRANGYPSIADAVERVHGTVVTAAQKAEQEVTAAIAEAMKRV